MQINADQDFLPLYDAFRAIKEKLIKPSELIASHVKRITEFDQKINAYQSLQIEAALSRGRHLDHLVSNGSWIGPFHGIPFALKDIFDLEGQITTSGCKLLENHVAKKSGTIVRRLCEAGGVVLGKSKTVEMAFGGWGTNQKMGTPKNPWDLSCLSARVCGGSSSGSAAAVASDMATCAVGSDTGGSVRIPAAFCGLTGLKVTEGRLPIDGITPLSKLLDTPGPMARSVMDTAIMFSVMLGVSGQELNENIETKSAIFTFLGKSPKNLTLGVLEDSEREKCDPEMLKMYDNVISLLHKEGADIKSFSSPFDYHEISNKVGDIISSQAYENHGFLYEKDSNPMDDDVRERVLRAKDINIHTKKTLFSDRSKNKKAFLSAIHDFDVLLTPTTKDFCPLTSDVDQQVSPGHFTRPINYFGMCALSLPIGLNSLGLPGSLQICAKPNAEGMAFRVAAMVEKFIHLDRKVISI